MLKKAAEVLGAPPSETFYVALAAGKERQPPDRRMLEKARRAGWRLVQ